MGKKFLWLVVSGLMVLSLVLAACAPAVTPGAPTTQTTSTTLTTSTTPTTEPIPSTPTTPATSGKDMVNLKINVDGIIVEKTVQKPQYGGTFTYPTISDPTNFDSALITLPSTDPETQVNSELLMGNILKGPLGTGENDWSTGSLWKLGVETGELAESWELVGDSTIVVHIRKGIKWQNKAPVNGREFVADDAAWNLNREWTSPKSSLYNSFPAEERLISAKATDKYTLEIKVPLAVQGLHLFLLDQLHMKPHEMVEKYGNMLDWKNACGTGPFLLADYVSASSVTYKRNPDYWQKDPFFPENQLPYLDQLKLLIIPDASTRLAALRTAKVDLSGSGAISWEDAGLLKKTTPQLTFLRRLPTGGCWAVAGRIDKPDLPFKDVRVRRALNMAVNKQELVDLYYGGNAELFAYPYNNDAGHKDVFIPLEQMSETAQEMFQYHPDKAKQLLAEAGYPTGFKTSVICQTQDVDVMSMIREYFLDVGVDMKINPLETGVYMTIQKTPNWPDMLYKVTKENNAPFKMHGVRKDSTATGSFFESPETRAAYNELNLYLGKNDAEVTRVMRGISPFIIEQAWGVWLPAPYEYQAWWPWVHNYEGQYQVGYYNPMEVSRYVWVDQALKKSMGR